MLNPSEYNERMRHTEAREPDKIPSEGDLEPHKSLRIRDTPLELGGSLNAAGGAGDLDDEIEVKEELGDAAERAKERDCVVDWLRGQQLRTDRATAFCWESDPFPISDFPDTSPAERRFFHYHNIAKLLGAKGPKKRAKLPRCVQKEIAARYGDMHGAPTKVGYQQEPAA